MHLEDAGAAFHVGLRHDDTSVETSRTQKGRVENVGPVGGGNQDDAVVGFEAVHLDKQLIERLLALVVTAAQAGAAVAPDGVDLVNKDDAGSVLLALLEQVAHPARTHAHEHLNEIRTGNRIERHARFASDSTCQKRLAGAGRPHHQDSLGNAAAQAGEFLWILEKSDDLFDFVFGFLDTGDVGKGHLFLVLRKQLGLRLAKAHGLAATHLKLAHEKQKDDSHDQNRQPGNQNLLPEAAFAFANDFVGNTGVIQLLQCLLANEARRDEGLVILLQRSAEFGVVAVHADFERWRWFEFTG